MLNRYLNPKFEHFSLWFTMNLRNLIIFKQSNIEKSLSKLRFDSFSSIFISIAKNICNNCLSEQNQQFKCQNEMF